MIKIFSTDKPYLYIILEDKKTSASVTKCSGYFMEGVFLGINVIDRREVTGLDRQTTEEILEGCFKKVFERDMIEEMRQHLVKM